MYSLLTSIALSFAQLATPQPVDAPWWLERHRAYVAEARSAKMNVLFLGDSITDGWRGAGKKTWKDRMLPLRALNFGIGGDRIEHLHWRVMNGETTGISPRVIVMLIGTNSLGVPDLGDIAAAHGQLVDEIHRRVPTARILLLAIFPRSSGQQPETPEPRVTRLNELLRTRVNAARVHYLDIGTSLLAPDGTISREIMPDGLHLSERGYAIWADAMLPKITELLDAR